MNALAALQVDSPLSYLIAVIIPALDAIFPVLPSETAIITLGVATAGSTDPRIALLVACCAAGAFLGDNLCYLLGRRFGPRIEGRFFRGEKGARRLAWAERSLERYGTPLIVVCRFIPGGRTAVMLCCGMVGFQRRRFVIATALAGSIWACYSFFIGRLGGRAFEDKPWAGLLLAFGASIAISALIELIRRLRARGSAAEPRAAAPEARGAAPEARGAAPEARGAAPEARAAMPETCSRDRVLLPPGGRVRGPGQGRGRIVARALGRGQRGMPGQPGNRGWHGISYRSGAVYPSGVPGRSLPVQAPGGSMGPKAAGTARSRAADPR